MHVSDNYIRVIPTEVTWQPKATAAAAAVGYIRALFTGPGDSVDEVACEFYDTVTFIDSGVNTDIVACPTCRGQIDLDWVFDVVGQRMDDLANLDAPAPCCGAVASLNELDYDWPVGFARFEIAVLNGTRAGYELNADELLHVGALLGHPVRQILAHY